MNAVQLVLNAALDDLLYFGGVESLMLPWLHPVSGEMRHARVSEIDHFLVNQTYF